ncbi:MAG TPA: hypothetical protein VHX65_17445 [Pirellulales bacterium]|nr:hypothetical protein [Pirellulales bacterium]
MACGFLAPSQAFACPFCGSVQSTLAQDIKGADVAVIGKLIALPKESESKDGELNVATPMATFEVEEVLKGAAAFGSVKKIEAPFFDEKPLGGEYLILGTEQSGLGWAPPYALSARSRKYVSEIVKLPALGPERLAYFQNYMEDKEDLLKNDSYYEFALAPYTMLQAMKPRMQHDKLVDWVRDPAVAVSHRRLYLTMLGVCGQPSDVPMLETLLRSDDPKFKTGLDATVACYLTLKRAAGLPLVENLFLNKKQEEFTDIFSVVMALRFLGQEDNGPIPRDRLIASMRLVLDHPRLADQAIMDLARWKDWTVMDRLVTLFKSADPETTTWVRIPVINYLRACPLPKAKQYIEELRKIDPKSVQQSETLYAVGPDPMPSVTTQRADSSAAGGTQAGSSANAAAPAAGAPAGGAAPAENSQTPVTPAAYKSTSESGAAGSAAGTAAATTASPDGSTSPNATASSSRMLPMAELVVAIGAVLGAVVLVVVNRSNRGSANVAGSKQ